LAKIGEQPFTVTFVEDSDYTQGEERTTGVKLTTKESFDIDGTKTNKFHTTRIAIVNRFKDAKLREDINVKKVTVGPIKCVSEQSASGKSFFNLVDA